MVVILDLSCDCTYRGCWLRSLSEEDSTEETVGDTAGTTCEEAEQLSLDAREAASKLRG
jgi:hypothetical protein